MYKILIPVLLLVFLISCTNESTKSKHIHYVKVYENALNMGDVDVAINACYQIIANDSNQNNYYDSLLALYLNTRNEGSTFLAARNSLKYRPNNFKITLVAAEYAKKLGMADTAINYYQRTYTLDKKLEYIYNIAQVQYNMGNDAGAEKSADQIISDPNSEKETIMLSLDKNNPQQIPLKAAALNIKGTIFIGMGSKEIALRYFNDALAIAPDFIIAKNNKADILSGKIKFEK